MLVRPADPLAAVPLRRPRRAVHDRAPGAGVEPARAGRHVGRRHLRPPVPRDERPRRPRHQGPQLRRVPQEADRELRDPLAHRAPRSHHARPRGAGAPASAAARCCSSIRRPKRCSRKCRISSSSRPSSRARSARSSSTLPDEVLTTTLIHHQHFFPVVGTNGALMPAFLAVTNTQTSQRSRDRHQRRARRHGAAARRAVLLGRRPADRARGAARAARDACSFTSSSARIAPKAERIERAGAVDRDRRASSSPRRGRCGARARRGWPRRTWRPTWCASSPSCRARWAASTRARPASPKRSGRRSTHHYLPIAVEADARADGDARWVGARVTWAAVSLADKLDTLVGLFLAGERPTGSRDPFGLRRQAHGILRILARRRDADRARHRGDLLSSAGDKRALQGYRDGTPPDDGRGRTSSAFLTERLQFVAGERGAATGATCAPCSRRAVARLAVPVVESRRTTCGRCRSSRSPSSSGSWRRRSSACATSPASSMPRSSRRLDAVAADGAASRSRRNSRSSTSSTARSRRSTRRRRAAANFREAYAEAAKFEPAVARFFNEVFVMADDSRASARRGCG